MSSLSPLNTHTDSKIDCRRRTEEDDGSCTMPMQNGSSVEDFMDREQPWTKVFGMSSIWCKYRLKRIGMSFCYTICKGNWGVLEKNFAEQTCMWILSMGGSSIVSSCSRDHTWVAKKNHHAWRAIKDAQRKTEEVDYFDGIAMAHFLVLEHD